LLCLTVAACSTSKTSPVPSHEEYREQAEHEIDDASADEELERLQREIEGDGPTTSG
jgi:hypothetical protein